MKKAYALLIAIDLLSAPAYSEPVSSSEAFVTLTKTAVSQQDLPTYTEVITPQQMTTYNASDAGEAVRHATSVQILPLGGSGSLETVHIRGSLSIQTLILIDGRPASGYALGSTDLSEIPEESIDHIEIVR